MNGYVTKPISPQHLYQTLYKVLLTKAMNLTLLLRVLA
jgi:CheY-like chemotaxis protein